MGRGLLALTRCAVASDDTAIAMDPSRVARRSFDCDLWLDHCTLAASRSVVELGDWAGVPSGPRRPWVIHSRGCAFLTLSNQRSRDGVLLRADADAYDGGALFWQSDGDTFDLDRVLAAAGPPAPPRPDELIAAQMVHFWASHRLKNPTLFSRREIRRRLPSGRITADKLLQVRGLPGPAGAGAARGAGGPSGGIRSGGPIPLRSVTRRLDVAPLAGGRRLPR